MKKTLALFGIVACAACTVSSLYATPDFTVNNPSAGKKPTARAAASNQATHYITTVQTTGSHLPLVVCRYRGRYYTQSPIAVYGAPQLDQTGQLNIGAQLNQSDPAISSAKGR